MNKLLIIEDDVTIRNALRIIFIRVKIITYVNALIPIHI